MAITTLAELAIKVVADMPYFPPENLVLDKLRWAWEQLHDQSEIWREDLTAIDAVAEQADYTLTHATGIIIRIIEVKLDDGVIDPIGYRMTSTSTLTFEEDYVPSEASTDGIEVEVALSPDINDDAGDAGNAWVLNKFYDGLLHGARWQLYAGKRKPWSDPDAALEEKELFQMAISDAITTRRQHRTTRDIGFRAFSA